MSTIVWKDGVPLKEVDDENAAFAFVLKHQGQSVDYALKHGGYSVGPASSYGCGDESCLSCYPFVRNCEHGIPFDEPIVNVNAELPECDHPCLWGMTNNGVDCGYGEGDAVVRGQFFCEIHAECVEMDDGIDTDVMRASVPSQDPRSFLAELFEHETCAECHQDANGHQAIIVMGNWFAQCLPFLVDDGKDVQVGEIVPTIGRFRTELEASEYIGTLPEYDTGRYGITDMTSEEGDYDDPSPYRDADDRHDDGH